MSAIGLILIIVAWVIQLNSNTNKIQVNFMKFYLAGVAILVIDSYLSNMRIASLLNLVALGAAGLVYLKVKKNRN